MGDTAKKVTYVETSSQGASRALWLPVLFVVVCCITLILIVGFKSNPAHTSNRSNPVAISARDATGSAPTAANDLSPKGGVSHTTLNSPVVASADVGSVPEPEPQFSEFSSRLKIFRKQASDWRDDHPVYAEFVDLLDNVLIPQWAHSELVRREIINTPGVKLNGYDRDLVDASIGQSCTFWFGNTIVQLSQLSRSGEIELNGGEVAALKGLLRQMTNYLPEGGPALTGPAPNPFKAGTFEATNYDRDLAETTSLVMSQVKDVILRLPPELENDRQELQRMSDELRTDNSSVDLSLLPRYVDPLEVRIAGISETVRNKVEKAAAH